MQRFSNVNTLLAFATVAREGTVSGAAEVLNLTQPAVSHQLKRLQEETGLTLFTRTATGLDLTPDGTAMLVKAEQVLAALGDFHRAARKRHGQIGGSLRIGTIVDPEFIRLGGLLKRLTAEHPGVETELTHGVSGETLSRLKRGQIDVGFYLSGPDPREDLEDPSGDPIHAVKLADFSYRVIGPAGWQGAVEEADWIALAAQPWIGTPDISVHQRLLRQVFAERDVQPKVVALVDQEASMLEMVRAGVGLSLCRESIALHQKQAFGLSVARHVSVPASLSFITLEKSRALAPVEAALDLLRRTWDEH